MKALISLPRCLRGAVACILLFVPSPMLLAADLSEYGFRETSSLWAQLLPSLMILIVLALAAAIFVKRRASPNSTLPFWFRALAGTGQAIRVTGRSQVGAHRAWLIEVEDYPNRIMLIEGKNGLAVHELSYAGKTFKPSEPEVHE